LGNDWPSCFTPAAESGGPVKATQGGRGADTGFAEQTAIVTGAGKGFGRAIALRLARDGARIVAADLDAAGAKETAALIRAERGEATPCAVDVASAESVEAMARCALAYGDRRVDVLVNNAGIWRSTPTEETTKGFLMLTWGADGALGWVPGGRGHVFGHVGGKKSGSPRGTP